MTEQFNTCTNCNKFANDAFANARFGKINDNDFCEECMEVSHEELELQAFEEEEIYELQNEFYLPGMTV